MNITLIDRLIGWSDRSPEARRRLLQSHALSQSLAARLLTAAALLLFGVLLFDQVETELYFLWLALTTCLGLSDYLYCRQVTQIGQDLTTPNRPAIMLLLLAAALGLAWGAGVPLLFPGASAFAITVISAAIIIALVGDVQASLPGFRLAKVTTAGLMILAALAGAEEWLGFTAVAITFAWLILFSLKRFGGPLSTLQHLDMKDRLESQTKELARADATKSDFLAIVGHEIRTPMYTILGMTELLGETKLDQRQRKLVTSLSTAGDYLSRLLNNILDFSRLNAGKKDIEAGDFNLHLLIENAVEIVKPNSDLKGLTITHDLTAGFPRFWTGDYGALNQITLNLLSNAVKYTNDGSVTLSVHPHEEKGFHLTVSDTGPGIEAHELPALFDPFQQVGGRSPDSPGGVGLGLAICKGLVDQMGGTIHMESTVGVGTQVKVWLPFEAAAGSSEAADKPFNFDLSRLPSARVLVVDDTDLSLEATMEFLNGLPFIIDSAMDGAEALELYQSRNYDLVLSDLRMPGLTGLELIQKIREFEIERHRRKVPIIILTAAAEHDERAKAFDAGCSAFMVKPLRRAELVRMVASYIGVETDRQTGISTGEPSENLDPALSSMLPKVAIRLTADLKSMARRVSEENYAEIDEMAHAAKGYCAVFGLPELSMIMGDIQTASQSKDPEAIRQGIAAAEVQLQSGNAEDTLDTDKDG